MKSFTQIFAICMLLVLPIITHADGVMPLGQLFVMRFFILVVIAFLALLLGGEFDVKDDKNQDKDK
ncbi:MULTISPECIES: hypothetical protein [unclassified Acinetobacter]|uniref:hypothetical protein n=2 Tax=Moraxellaceae TaxID=468 RepID=UPI0005554BC3|nr:hypothetical protein [Acinetobacter sp. HR7]